MPASLYGSARPAGLHELLNATTATRLTGNRNADLSVVVRCCTNYRSSSDEDFEGYHVPDWKPVLGILDIA